MAKISVIVPVHNTGEYVEQAVASLQNQSLSDIEIILVENASSDDSLERCMDIAAKDPRIKVLHLDRGDLSLARNEGIKAATSGFVGFMDSDDEILPEMYEVLYGMVSEHGLDLAVCNYLRDYPSGRKKYGFCEDGKVHLVSPKEMTALNLTEIIPQSACVLLVRREIAVSVPFPVGMHFEDRITTFRYAAAAKACGYINRTFYLYHQYRGKICRSGSFKRNHDFAVSDMMRLEFIRNSGMFTESEMPAVSRKAAESLLRKINRMRKSCSTLEERSGMEGIMAGVGLVPDGTRLSLKARIIRYMVRKGIFQKII